MESSVQLARALFKEHPKVIRSLTKLGPDLRQILNCRQGKKKTQMYVAKSLQPKFPSLPVNKA